MCNISICEGCGRTVDGKFLYCPWCGFSRIEHGEKSSLEALLNHHEENMRDQRRKQLYKLEKELEELEKELSVLVLSAEMHK